MNKHSLIIKLSQIFLLILFITLWEYLSNHNIINSFIFSSPSKICKCIITLAKKNDLFSHILTTLYEVSISFTLSIVIAISISILFYELPIVYKILDPYLTVFNSMPKVALGPLIIILFGATQQSIIITSLSITLILNILTIYNGFTNTDEYLYKYLLSLKSTKFQILKYLVIPSAYSVIINSLKINISMTLIGVIMGEFLISKKGIGYLIIYGTQVFNLTLVISGIVILMIISYALYLLINYIEKFLNKKISNKS